MRLSFLGTGAAFFPAEGSNAAYWRQGEDLYLIDCGESVFASLMQRKMLERGHELTILLTHLHADHCGSLGTTCLYAADCFARVTVVHPHEQADALLPLVGVKPSTVRRVSSLERPDLRVMPITAMHLNMPAYGYLIEDEQETIYYSGDATDIPAPVLDSFLEGNIGHIYQDCLHDGTDRREHPAHMPFALLCDRIPPAQRNRVTIMHFNRDFRAEAEAAGFRCARVKPL